MIARPEPPGYGQIRTRIRISFLARTTRKTIGPVARSKRRREDAPAGIHVDGVRPTHQLRSRAKHDALITSGIRMLEERDYKSLSIADLTAANGVSIGAFYARFSGKDAYFNALQAQVFADVAAEAAERFAPQAWASKSARCVIDAFAAFFVGLVRRHRGVIFAALQQETSHPTAWTPVRKSGAAVAEPFLAVLVPKLAHIAPAQRAARAGFAVQVLYGTLINAVLHDPGPLALGDHRLAGEMSRVLAGYLGLDASQEDLQRPPSRRQDKRRKNTTATDKAAKGR